MEEPSTWNVGTIIWLAVGVLLAWGLLAALWDWLLGLPTSVGDWRESRRRSVVAAELQQSSAEALMDAPGEPVGPEYNWCAETGNGPAGDPKIWCGTCAEAAKRQESE